MKNNANNRVTIYDIAQLAGVSTGTVSRVLNNSAKVNAETRQRVLHVARSQGMRPRAVVRRRQIALVTAPPSSVVMGGYVSSLTQHLAYSLATRGLSLVMVTEDHVDQLPNQLIDAVIAVAWWPRTVETLKKLDHTPVVFINRLDLADQFSVVGTDHVEAGRQAGEYLIARGHHRLALLNEKSGWSSEARAEGFRQAMRAHRLEIDERLILCHERGDRLHGQLNRVVKWGADALWLPGEDMEAIKGLHILQELMRLTVPKDISVLGAENPGLSAHTCPALTTLEQPLSDLADQALQLVLELEEAPVNKPRQILLPTRLIERDSVALRQTASRQA